VTAAFVIVTALRHRNILNLNVKLLILAIIVRFTPTFDLIDGRLRGNGTAELTKSTMAKERRRDLIRTRKKPKKVLWQIDGRTRRDIKRGKSTEFRSNQDTTQTYNRAESGHKDKIKATKKEQQCYEKWPHLLGFTRGNKKPQKLNYF
jgi:hypothetical protein